MITFDFYMPEEKLPNDNETIVFLSKHSSFGTEYLDVRSGTIEYVWEELDENGEYNGNSLCYDADDFMDDPTVRLNILIVDHTGGYDFFDYVFCWNYPFDLEGK
jgi:hypothetical protein